MLGCGIALAGDGLLSMDWVADLTVTSRVDFDAEATPVEITLSELAVTAAEAPLLRFSRASDGMEIASQFLPADWTHAEDRILLVVPLDAGASEKLVVTLASESSAKTAFPPRAYAEISRKFGGEWQADKIYSGGSFSNVNELTVDGDMPDHNYFMRYEGPGWESDKVGFRIYLDGRNGFDVFGKLTPNMVLGGVGLDGYQSYHEPAGWGMDILKVAQAVGLGGFGAFHEGSVVRVTDVDSRSTRVVAAGPLYAGHDLTYTNWQVGNRSTDLRARVAIHAGAYHTMVHLDSSENMPMATGIVRLDGAERVPAPEFVLEKEYTWLATFGNQTMNGEPLGMAIFYCPRDVSEVGTDANNHYIRLRLRNGKANYAFAAVWEPTTGGKLDLAAFQDYLKTTALLLNRPPVRHVENRMDRIHKRFPVTGQFALDWAVQVARTTMDRRGDSLAHGYFDPEANRSARWGYTTGLLSLALDELSDASGDPRFAEYAAQVMGSFVDEEGNISTYSVDEYNIDHIAGGRVLQRLSERTGDPRFEVAIASLMRQLEGHPRTEADGFWHKQVYPYQMWLDGLYMGAPFYAGEAIRKGNQVQLEDAVRQFEIMFANGRHPQTGWLMHAWDESRAMPWADKQTGLSSEIWGRAVGWYAMGLVDVMAMLPADSPLLKRLQLILEATAKQILHFQDSDSGMWYQVMDKGGETGNYLEASASSMFVYALAKAARHGWLGDDAVRAARAGFDGLVRTALSLGADGSARLGQICEVAGLSDARDGSYNYYMSEPIVFDDNKGTGPFIFAGIELFRLLSNP